MTIDNETINLLFKALISILGILIARVFIPWLKNKLGEQKWQKLEEYTELAVRTAEMIFTVEEWKEKKEYVLNYVSTKAEEIGLDVTAEDINICIEGWVQLVKRGNTNVIN